MCFESILTLKNVLSVLIDIVINKLSKTQSKNSPVKRKISNADIKVRPTHLAFKTPLRVGAGTEMRTQYLPVH